MIQLRRLTYKSIDNVQKDGAVIHFAKFNNFHKFSSHAKQEECIFQSEERKEWRRWAAQTEQAV